MSKIFITGGTGCIGSVTISQLLKDSAIEKIVVATRSNNAAPLHLWLGEELDPRIEFVKLDVSDYAEICLLYTSPSPRDGLLSRMPSSA